MAGSPDHIGKFRVEGLLGRGAMGVVFKAHDPDIDRTVAIKLVRTDLLDGDDRAHYIARFRNEAKMVGRCIHPNIVGIYDFSVHDGSPFLVLEYVDGVHLGRHISRGTSLDLPTVERTMLQVLGALAYAHDFGIVHRDIKPANILLSAESETKVTDFGISRALASDATMSSVLVGTPCYMSPEQCLGGAIDARSDLFSLGCVLYEALSGQRAFAAENYVATTHRVLHDTPTKLRELRPDLPAALVGVVEMALAKRADDRFGNARAMADALRLACSGAEVDATIVMPSARRMTEGASELGALEPKSIATIERRLAFYVGPVARHHLRRTMGKASSPEELCQLIAEFVPAGDEREDLRKGLLGIVAADGALRALRSKGSPSSASLPRSITADDEIAYTRALAQILGPIAPLLIRRAMVKAKTLDELEAACVALINRPEEIARFRSSIG